MSQHSDKVCYSAVMMGTRIELHLSVHRPELATEVFRRIKQWEDLLTVNRPESQLMSVNQAAGKYPVRVSPSVFALIARAHRASLEGGCFNLAIGPLVRCWKIGFSGDRVPQAETLAGLLPLTDPRAIRLNADDCSVFLTRAGMSVDAGAIAKGYMADLICDYLASQSITRAMINLGGNIRVMTGAGETGWKVGLQQPFGRSDQLLGVISTDNSSVVTSGVYERYFVADGKHYHHILDPRSGYPLDNDLLSVTVISPLSIDGEILSTQLYGMGLERGCQWLTTRPDIDAIFVTRDRQVVVPAQRRFRLQRLPWAETITPAQG